MLYGLMIMPTKNKTVQVELFRYLFLAISSDKKARKKSFGVQKIAKSCKDSIEQGRKY